MPTFSSIDEALKSVERSIEKVAINDVSKEAKKSLERNIRDTVYSTPEGWYERTESFLNSVSSKYEKFDSKILVVAFNDPSLMNPNHVSYINPNKIVDKKIGKWLNEGHGGLWNYSGKYFYQKTDDDMKREIKNIMIKGLKKYRIDAY